MGVAHGQMNVVGVAFPFGVDVVAIGPLTTNVSELMDAQIVNANADTVADGFSLFRNGVITTVNDSYSVCVTDGDLSWVNGAVRITSETGPTRTYDVDEYATDLGDHWITFVGGAIVRGTGDSTAPVTPVPVAFTGDAALFAVPILTTDATGSGGFGSGATL